MKEQSGRFSENRQSDAVLRQAVKNVIKERRGEREGRMMAPLNRMRL